MTKLDQESLTRILEKHKLWLQGNAQGERANLSGMDLSSRDLTRAILIGTDLTRANLTDAILRLATISFGDLSFAILIRTDLTRANLTDAILRFAPLISTNLTDAILIRASLRGANLTGANLDYDIEPGLLRRIAQIVIDDENALEMADWHTCGTTHCLAGWACHLSEKGKELEAQHGTAVAALLLLGPEAHSHFYDSNEDARKYLEGVVGKRGDSHE